MLALRLAACLTANAPTSQSVRVSSSFRHKEMSFDVAGPCKLRDQLNFAEPECPVPSQGYKLDDPLKPLIASWHASDLEEKGLAEG